MSGLGKLGAEIASVAMEHGRADAVRQATEQEYAEPLQRDEQGNLVVPDLKPAWFESYSDEARRLVRASRYGSELVLGLQGDAVKLRTANPTLDGFTQAAGRWVEETAKNAPAGLREVVVKNANALMTEHIRSIRTEETQRERTEAAARSGEVLQRYATDGADLIRAGRDGDAFANEGPIGMAVAKLRSDAVARIIDPADAIQQERRLTVVMPEQMRLRRQLAGMSPEAGLKLVETLRSGAPGLPGWREGWTALSPGERAAIANTEDNALVARRREAEHGEALGRKAQAERAQALTFEWSTYRAGVMRGADPNPALEQGIIDRLRKLGPAGMAVAGQVTVQGAQLDQAEARERAQKERDRAHTQAVTDRARANTVLVEEMRTAASAALMPDGNAETPGGKKFAELSRIADTLNLEYQPEFWARHARDAEEAARRLQRAEAPIQALNLALAGKTQVQNNRENQELVTEGLRRQGVVNFNEPQAAHLVTDFARAGVVPQAFVSRAAAALRGSNPADFAGVADVVRTAQRDPIAWREMRAALGDRLADAYEGMGDSIAALERNPQAPARVLDMMTNARKIAEGDPSLAQEQLVRIDPDPGKARGLLTTSINDAAEGLGGDPVLPPRMRSMAEARTLSIMALGKDRDAAAQQAFEELTRSGRWTLSSSTIGDTVPELGSGVRALLRGGAERSRWVANAAETITAPYGRGGVEDTAWQQDFARRTLATIGVKPPSGQGHILGLNTFWRPTEQYQDVDVDGQKVRSRLYKLYVPDPRTGFLYAVGAPGADGRETAAPLLLPLAAEAARHRKRWEKDRGEAETRRRQTGAE
jgi:hypothetical protein